MSEMITSDELATTISGYAKAIKSATTTRSSKGIGFSSMKQESDNARISQDKARILTKMSPTLGRGIQILSGMVACPEGGTRTNLNYTLGDVDGISEDKKASILTILKKYFDNELGFESTLADTIRRIIGEIGADVEVYIPKTLISELVAVESTGYIKSTKDNAPSPITYNENDLSIGTDMTALTMTPLALNETVGAEANANKGGRGRLSRINRTTLAISNNGVIGKDGVIVRKTTGAAVIPIVYNGRVIKYVGILDSLGQFITNTDSTSFIDLMDSSSNDAENTQYEILSHDAKLIKDAEQGMAYKKVREGIENDVIRALVSDPTQGGLEGVLNSLGEENVLDILTARSMASKKTRVIMLDPEYVSYFALLKNQNGRGITIIEDNSSIILLHVTLLYAKILAELDSSIPKTQITARLDEIADTNPTETLKDILGEVASGAAKDYNIDYTGNKEMFTSLSKINTHIKVENANVPGMPNMDIEIERGQREVRAPDSGILETTGKFAIQTLGISSELVDNSYGERFKLQVSRDNDITSRQMTLYIDATNDALTDRGMKRISHNDDLWNELQSTLGTISEDNESKLIELLATFNISLPESTSAKFENLSDKLDIIVSGIRDYVEAAIPDTVIDNGERIDRDTLSTMREMVIGATIRSFASNSDIFGGLGADLTSMEGIAEIVKGELENYGDVFKDIIPELKRFNKTIIKSTEKFENMEDEVETPPADTPDTTPPVEESTPEDTTDDSVEDPDADPAAPEDTSGEFDDILSDPEL